MSRIHKIITILFCIALIPGCDSTVLSNLKKQDKIDPGLNLEREDYRDMYNQKAPEGGVVKLAPPPEPPIPDIAEVLASPQPPKLGETKLVSIAVTDDVPLKDVLIELARLADVDIEVDSSISGGISFRAKDRPFNEVIDRISDLAGLRYSMKNSVLRVERDTPYIVDYPINFLSIDRSTNGSFNVTSTGGSTALGSSSSGSSGSGSSGGSSTGGGGGGSSSGGSSGSSSGAGSTTGSTASISSKSDSDFWNKFDESIKQILAYSESKRISGTTIERQPDAPDAPAGAPAQAAVGSSEGPAKNSSFYIMNRQASTLTVSATDRQHEMIKRFLRMVEANTSSQVLIEAKVLEVSLNENYQTGIDWAKLGGSNALFSGNLSTVSPTINPGIAAPSLVLNTGADLSATVSMLNEFGTTRALSSPRLHAMNNQQAVLSFAQGLVYFSVQISVTDAVPASTVSPVTVPAKVSVVSTPLTVPVGIILTIQPSIDTKNNEVTLNVRPTLTRLITSIVDPGFEISKAEAIAQLASSGGDATEITSLQNITNKIPEIETRELDSIVKIKSGQTLIVGGLLEDSNSNTDSGLPGASEIPLFGDLFKSVNKINSRDELVFFIRATIVPTSDDMDKADKTVYEKFGNDPRPIDFNTQ